MDLPRKSIFSSLMFRCVYFNPIFTIIASTNRTIHWKPFDHMKFSCICRCRHSDIHSQASNSPNTEWKKQMVEQGTSLFVVENEMKWKSWFRWTPHFIRPKYCVLSIKNKLKWTELIGTEAVVFAFAYCLTLNSRHRHTRTQTTRSRIDLFHVIHHIHCSGAQARAN